MADVLNIKNLKIIFEIFVILFYYKKVENEVIQIV